MWPLRGKKSQADDKRLETLKYLLEKDWISLEYFLRTLKYPPMTPDDYEPDIPQKTVVEELQDEYRRDANIQSMIEQMALDGEDVVRLKTHGQMKHVRNLLSIITDGEI